MKKIILLCFCMILVLVAIGFSSAGKKNIELTNADYLRIHIRANSNEEIDQDIKYVIKDKLVEFLTPKIAICKTKDEVVEMIIKQKYSLTEMANIVLNQNGLQYSANIKIDSEMFPTRTYEGYTLQSGVYDAIIVELGSAKGNNWWCVMYPPLCFVNYSNNSAQGIVYKSKIWEIINQFFNK